MLITELEPGGAERVLWQLVRGLREDFALTVAALDGRGEYAGHIRAEGVEVIDLGARNVAYLLPAILRLRRLLRARKFCLLNTHLFHAGIVGRLAAAGTGVPVIGTAHIVERRNVPWRFWLERLTAGLCKREICVSAAVRDFLRGKTGLPLEYYHVIHNGIDTGLFCPPADKSAARRALGFGANETLVGFLGRFDPQKGADVFLAALDQPPLRARTDFIPVLAGYGAELKRLRALAPQRAVFTGYQPRPELFLQALDICVVPSRWEGFGLVAIEAQACGAAVIASRADSLPELITHDRSGLLFAPGDAGELAAAVARLIDDPALRSALARAGMESAAAYTVPRMCAQYRELFRAFVGNSHLHTDE